MLVRTTALRLLPLLLPVLLAAACDPATDGDAGPNPGKDAGSPAEDAGQPPADAGGNPGDDGGAPEDGGPPPGEDAGNPGTDYPNETCATAEALTPGQTKSASTSGGNDDHQGSCGASATGPEVVYAVTLAEASGLVVEAGGYDIVLRVAQGGCEDTDELEGGCVDDTGSLSNERLAFPVLPAGEYFVIVDSYFSAGGDFDLDVEVIPGGYCGNDEIDLDAPNETPAEAASIGAGNVDTRDVDPVTDGAQPFDLQVCDGDVDYYLVGHMGGTLDVDVALVDGAGTLTAEVYAATLEDDGNGAKVITEGAKVADAPLQQLMDRGLYLVKVAGSGVAATGDHYYAAVTHECQADEADAVIPELDDGTLENVYFSFSDDTAAPVERRVCDGDTDTVLLEVATRADVQVTLANAAGLAVNLEQVVVQNGNRTTVPYTQGVGTATQGQDLVYTIGAVPPGTELLLSVAAPTGLAGEVAYSVAATFDRHPPANDTCDTAISLDAAADSAPVIGYTTGGNHEVAGSCNGDESATAGAPDVFYRFSLAQARDTEIRFDGRPFANISSFYGAVYLLAYPGSCPADLAELQRVPLDPSDPMSAPVCGSDSQFRLRVPGLSAGEYLLVVDGENFFGPEDGAFSLSVRSFADGFPPPLACVEATTQTLPGPGESVSFQVDTTVGIHELGPDEYSCSSFGGTGAERVISFTPLQNLTVNITASGTDGENGFDTLIVLQQGTCGTGPEVTWTSADGEVSACDDDSTPPGSLGSGLAGVPLVAGETYHLIVDGFSSEGTTTVTITAQQ